MKNKIVYASTASVVLSGLLFSQAAHASTFDVAFAEMNFGAVSGTDQPTIIGDDAGLNFSHRYDDVISGVDAIATVIAVQNLDNDDNELNGVNGLLEEFDDSDSTSGKSINVGIDVFGASGATETGYVTFRIDFVAADTSNAVTLQNIAMRINDIDSNQYASFAGITAHELSATPPTELTVSNAGGAYEFKEPLGNSSSSGDQENWVVVEYAAASSITLTLGARESGGASFGVAFADTTWSSAATRVVPALTAYTLTYDGNSATAGSVPAAQSSTTSSSSVTLAAPQGNLLRTNCTFGGWNSKADGTGATYLDASSITLTANTTLFAKWTCVTPSSTPTPSPTPRLATTGTDLSGAWIATGFIAGAGAILLGVRRAVRKKFA